MLRAPSSERRLESAKFSEGEPRFNRLAGPATRRDRSPGRQTYNQRLLSARFLITVNHPELSVAEASRLAFDAVGPYTPGKVVSAEEDAALAKSISEKAAQMVSAKKGLVGSSKPITSTPDAASSSAANSASNMKSALAPACTPGAFQIEDQAGRQPQQTQLSMPAPQQSGCPEQQKAEQTTAVGSECSKVNPGNDMWNTQLRAARQYVGANPVYNLHTAKNQMDSALRYLKVREHGLQRLKQQADTVKNMKGGLDLEGYLLRERRCIESDIELECAKIATLACVIELLERSKERIQKKLNDKASGP